MRSKTFGRLNQLSDHWLGIVVYKLKKIILDACFHRIKCFPVFPCCLCGNLTLTTVSASIDSHHLLNDILMASGMITCSLTHCSITSALLISTIGLWRLRHFISLCWASQSADMNVYNSANTNNNQTDLTSASVLAHKVSVVHRIRPLRVGIERYLLLELTALVGHLLRSSRIPVVKFLKIIWERERDKATRQRELVLEREKTKT